MKKKVKLIIGLATACAGMLVLGACASQSPYGDLAKRDFTVSVRFDTNGGTITSKENTSVVDTFRLEDVQRGVKLLPLDDSHRDMVRNVERTGYFLVGWYTERNMRTDEEGNPLDEDGNLCHIESVMHDPDGNVLYDGDGNERTELLSDYGKPQGYTYGGLWDFENDRFRLDSYEYREDQVALTLYAAWVPEFSYQIYGKETVYQCDRCGARYFATDYANLKDGQCTAVVNGNVCASDAFTEQEPEWTVFSSYAYNPELTDTDSIAVPSRETSYDEETGQFLYGEFPAPERSVTLKTVYRDPELSESVSELSNTGTWDKETATATNNVARYYAEWDEGLWYKISTPGQLSRSGAGNRCFDIAADLNFSPAGADPVAWPAGLSGSTYSGHFKGNGHKIEGVTVNQDNSQDLYRGLFGRISESATVENVRFENVTYNFSQGSRVVDSYFGMFTGFLSPGATLTGVSINGTFTIGDDVFVPPRTYDPYTGTFGEQSHFYDVGLLTGNLVTGGVSMDGIKLVYDEEKLTVTLDETTGKITIS